MLIKKLILPFILSTTVSSFISFVFYKLTSDLPYDEPVLSKNEIILIFLLLNILTFFYIQKIKNKY